MPDGMLIINIQITINIRFRMRTRLWKLYSNYSGYLCSPINYLTAVTSKMIHQCNCDSYKR